jgi:hypothetical protein
MGTRLASLAMTRLAARISVMLLALCVLMLFFALIAGHLLPSAGHLLYISSDSQTAYLRMLDFEHGISVQISREDRMFSPLFPSPDGRQIAFSVAYSEIPATFVMNADGSDRRSLGGDPLIVGWFPDNVHILTSDIMQMTFHTLNTHDSSGEVIAQLESPPCGISFSPDKQFMSVLTARSILESRNEYVCTGVSVTRVESGEQREFLPNATNLYLVWSPDSRQIALLNNFSLFVVPDVTQDNVVEVREMAMRVPISTLAWSPDSSRFALSADIGFDIFVVPVVPELGEPVNITRSPNAQDVNPVWLRGGHEIAFISTRDTYNGEIYLMNADGSNVRRLTDNAEREIGLVWLP